MSKIKKIIKKFVKYTIEGDEKVYTLKSTPLKLRRSMTKAYHERYDDRPIEPKKIVFDNYMGQGYGCNTKAACDALLTKETDYDIVWIVKDVEAKRDAFPSQVRLVEYGSEQAFAEYATAGVWVNNFHLVAYINKGLQKRPGQTYIQMWHGSFGIKKIENDCRILTEDQPWTMMARKNSEWTDYWISNSTFETEVYQQAFWNVREIMEYGHPRNDVFFRDMTPEQKSVQQYFEIDAQQPLVLYVPTFRDNDNIEGFSLDYTGVLDSLRERFGGAWMLLIRMHPKMKEQAAQVIPQHPQIKDATDYPDIQELLAAVDVVITDYSSCIFDFMLTKRPGFIYATDAAGYEQQRGLYYPLRDTPFPVAVTNEQLQQQITEFNQEQYERDVTVFLEGKGSKEDGHAAERVADLICHSIEKRDGV